MFAQRPLPPSFQFFIPFIVAATALQVMAVQHANAEERAGFAPTAAIVSSLR